MEKKLNSYMGVQSNSQTAHIVGIKDIKQVYEGKTFPGCNHPPVHLLTLDLSKFDCFSESIQKIGKLPIIYSNCESCDAWMMEGEDLEAEMHFQITAKNKLKPLNPKQYSIVCSEDSQTREPEKEYYIDFVPYEGDQNYKWHAVYVGGEPKWVQEYESISFCTKCSEEMDFIATVRAVRFGCGDQDLYIFVCPGCKTMGMTMQFT